jgi:hypothetical protein
MAPDATPEDEKLYANYGETPFLGGCGLDEGLCPSHYTQLKFIL